MFDTDLTRDYAAASSLGVDPRSAYQAGLEGALCDEGTRKRLHEVGKAYDWSRLARAELV
jgi:aminodeoxyfutalosine deaminase